MNGVYDLESDGFVPSQRLGGFYIQVGLYDFYKNNSHRNSTVSTFARWFIRFLQKRFSQKVDQEAKRLADKIIFGRP